MHRTPTPDWKILRSCERRDRVPVASSQETAMIKFTVISTKGGVGKTTLTANLGGLFADLGLRVLLIDADVQPSLSKYFPLAVPKPAAGLTEMIVRGEVTDACITATMYQNLDIVVSDDPEGRLPHWLMNRIDRGFRLRMALNAEAVSRSYDCVLIDTQGAVGPLQDAAALAADILISPITPEILSAREFQDGTMELLDRLEPSSLLGATLGTMKAVIYRQDRTLDARAVASGIREDFIKLKGRVAVLDTVVPHAKAYKEAATARIPVHRHERRRTGAMPSAYTVMHELAWELIPSLKGDIGRFITGTGVDCVSGEHDNRQPQQAILATARAETTSRPISIEERRRLVAASLRVGNPGNNARDLPAAADPRHECQIEVRVMDIRTYEHNPRRANNAKFAEIKASIAAIGIRSPLTVTRRPGEEHFIVETGGNTRLIAIQQLWAETGDLRFEKLIVLFRPWRSESQVLTAHLIENEQRWDMTFWDKACGVMRLRSELENELNRALSLSQLEEELRGRGYTVSKAALGFCAFAVQRLSHLGQALPLLTSDAVKRLQQGFNRLKRYAESGHAVAEAELYSEVIDPVLQDMGNRLAATGVLDPDAIWEECASALARHVCRPRVEVLRALGTAVYSAEACSDPSTAARVHAARESLKASTRTPREPVAELVRRLAALTEIESLLEWASDTPCGFRLQTLGLGANPQDANEARVERSRRAWQLLHCLVSENSAPAATDPPGERFAEATLISWLLDPEDRAAGVFLDLVSAVRRRHRAKALTHTSERLVTAPETC